MNSLPPIFRISDVPVRCSMSLPEFAPVSRHNEPRPLSEPGAVPDHLRPGGGEEARIARMAQRRERGIVLLHYTDDAAMLAKYREFVRDDPAFLTGGGLTTKAHIRIEVALYKERQK